MGKFLRCGCARSREDMAAAKGWARPATGTAHLETVLGSLGLRWKGLSGSLGRC